MNATTQQLIQFAQETETAQVTASDVITALQSGYPNITAPCRIVEEGILEITVGGITFTASEESGAWGFTEWDADGNDLQTRELRPACQNCLSPADAIATALLRECADIALGRCYSRGEY